MPVLPSFAQLEFVRSSSQLKSCECTLHKTQPLLARVASLPVLWEFCANTALFHSWFCWKLKKMFYILLKATILISNDRFCTSEPESLSPPCDLELIRKPKTKVLLSMKLLQNPWKSVKPRAAGYVTAIYFSLYSTNRLRTMFHTVSVVISKLGQLLQQ